MKRPQKTDHWLWIAVLLTWAGFVLRIIRLADVPPRWDEGWSVAHAALPWPELLSITAADVHPPLYYLLLSAWQSVFGVNLFGARYLSVLMSAPAVPLAFAVAVAWLKSRRAGVFAAALTAWLPLLVYYGAVVRMYALAPSFILLASWAAVHLASPSPASERRRHKLTWSFVVGATGAMLTLYHAAWALSALGMYSLGRALRNRVGKPAQRLAPLGSAIVLSVLIYLPWAIYALPQLYGRAAAEAGANVAQQYPLWYFLENSLIGLTMAQQTGWAGVGMIGVIVLLGLLVCMLNGRQANARPRWSGAATLGWPLFSVALTLVGVAIAARHWTLNARMLIGAAPALALLLAWAFEQIASQHRRLVLLPALALLGVYAGTSAAFVYDKNLEVFDPYNPHTYRENIAPYGHPDDVAVFNVLSPAGFYALDRRPTDPAWSYALTWDPVIEPRARWEARIAELAQRAPRFWLVLYRGLAGKNGDLRGWVDSNYFPALAKWGEEEVFYGLYGAAHAPLSEGAGMGVRWGDLELRRVMLANEVRSGDVIPVALVWRVLAPLPDNLKIFVHAVDDNGAVVAQHDAQPLNDLRPMTTLPVGEDINDRHGLALPQEYTGRLRILLGLYDPTTGQRVLTTEGRDALTIGWVSVR
ncbi:MAG: glycosyltransferase family 39 protein [Anaerolineae bacterium]|nr:glycosyltransferase family 39 protein [Thermoflexales bacterium]MDW8407800.1 glycosyltransferase family 39 protein [Anaerolineae bacterium]